MKLSEDGVEALVKREGIKLKAYQDTKGIWTIGIGHTGPEVVKGYKIDIQKAYDLFYDDVEWAEDAVNMMDVTLTQNQFDALVSFVFNIGATAFLKSTMRKLLKAGDYVGAVTQFDRWVIPKEVTGRRMSEKAQFQTP